MLSVQEQHPSNGCWMAVYKGVNVAVYSVDKAEVSLTRRDLIELIKVCSFFVNFRICIKPCYLWTFVSESQVNNDRLL